MVRVIPRAPRIAQPISWGGRPRRFLFWTWTEYRALFTDGEWRRVTQAAIEANAYD